MVFLLVRPVASSLIKAITGTGIIRAGKGQGVGFLPFLALPLIMNAMSGRD